MMARDIFNEALKLRLSPIVFTGRVDSTKSSLLAYLNSACYDDQFMVYDTMTTETAEEFIASISLKNSPLLYIVIDSRGVTDRAWQKVLKALEDMHASTTILFVSDGKIPRAIETRCFRCHIPASLGTAEYSGPAAFAVGSWIIGVDYNNREQVIKSCQGWTVDNTDLLLRELGGIITGEPILNVPVIRLETPKIMYAIDNLSKHYGVPTAALSTGLRLIG